LAAVVGMTNAVAVVGGADMRISAGGLARRDELIVGAAQRLDVCTRPPIAGHCTGTTASSATARHLLMQFCTHSPCVLPQMS